MKSTVISIIVAIFLIGTGFVLSRGDDIPMSREKINNVSVVDGKQIIEITARGGYLPRQSIAKANIPTIVRFKTNGTYDCSSSIRIPSMNILKSLSPTGSTDIDIGTVKESTLKGTCGMGMYSFEIVFQG